MKARKVYYGKKGECSVICHQCGKVSKVDTNDVQLNQVVEIKCGCQNSFQVQLEKREYYRKDVKLTGIFERVFPRDTTKGKLIIEDLSYTGIGCRSLAKHYLEINDVVGLEFALDDLPNSQITENVIVRTVRDKYLGIEFQDLSQHSRKLIGFYLLPVFDTSAEYVQEAEMEPPDTTALILEASCRVDEAKSTSGKAYTQKTEREYSRAKVSWPLSILTVQGPLKGKVRDISLTGALIHCHELPDPNQPIPMAMEIPEQHYSLFATGETIRLDIEDGESDHPSFLLEVRFAEISEEDLSFLSIKVLH